MIEVVFPPKVSGFYERKDGPPKALPIGDFQTNLKKLDEFSIDWQFIDMSAHTNYSYHCCYFEWEQAHYFFFMNKYYYLGAFSRIEDVAAWKAWKQGELLPRNYYADLLPLAPLLSPPWTIIPEEMLTQHVDADNEVSQKIVMQLQNAEFAEFSYWEPQNMGNILFNNWEK